jgi:hypothetical protein
MVAVTPLVAALGGALAGAGAVGIPALKWAWETHKDAKKAVKLLEGRDEFEDDGVIPRLRNVERNQGEIDRRVTRIEPDDAGG